MAQISSNTDMDVNCNIIRGRSTLSNKSGLRGSSISSSTSLVPYYKCIEINNDLLDLNILDPIDSFQLSYAENANISESANKINGKKLLETGQHVIHEAPALKTISKPQDKSISNNNSNKNPQKTFNMQLLYDVNQTIEQDTWNRNFHSISLYRSLKHLPSNANNIKKSLYRMIKYILNKKIENSKSNEVNDFKDIDKVAWNFISAIYELGWDSLIANNNNISFRSKILAKFTLKINKVNTNKNKSSKSTDKLATINNISSHSSQIA